MRISFRFIILIWVLLFAALGVIIYTTYSRLQPETFVTLLKEQVEKNYPGSTVKIGSLDYRPALDLSLSFMNIEITGPEGKLGSIGELEVRVPWWLLISDRGNAQINISRLEVFVNHEGEKKERSTQETSPREEKKIKVELPDYMARARYTFRAKDIMIRDARNSRRNFALSKLLVKEFQYGKNSAFELNLPIEINHNKAKFTSELWLFGDVTPEKNKWSLNFRGEFKTRDLTDKSDLEDLEIDGKADFSPSELNLQSTLAFLIERQKVGDGEIVANKSALTMKFDFKAFPLEYLSIFSEELQNPYLPTLSGPSEGMVRFHRGLKEDESVKLESSFAFEGNFPLGPDHQYPGKWQFSFSDSKWETSFITPKSEVSFFRRSIIDIPRGEVVQFIEEIGFTGIEIEPAMKAQMTLPHFRTSEFPHYYSTRVSLKECIQAEARVSGTLFHGYTPHERFYQLELKGNGEIKLDYLAKDNSENLKLEMNKFAWSPGYKFFDPIFLAESALLTGKVEGKWTGSWDQGLWLSQMKLTGLQSPAGTLPTLIQKLWSQFSIDPSGVADQSWSASLKNKVFTLNALTLEGSDPARIVGTIAPSPAKSQLTLTYPKNRKWKPVRKDLPEFTW